jgi:hypothetical protein
LTADELAAFEREFPPPKGNVPLAML